MIQNIKIDIIEHAIDNSVNAADYRIHSLLEEPRPFVSVTPEPCTILPRQFGYWFHTGPGFANVNSRTYGHKILGADNVTVLGCDGVVAYGDWTDATSLNYVRPDDAGCQFRREGSQLFRNPVSRKLEGIYFLGFNAGHSNYAHWLTDALPLLGYYMEHYAPEGVKVLLPARRAAFVDYYVKLLQIPGELIEYISDEVIEVETLLHPSFFSFDHIPYSAAAMLKDLKAKYLPPQTAKKRRIFVSRSETSVRALLNEQSLTRILQSSGFEIIVPGNLPVADQISLFRDAEIVMGVHGAGMANIIFCEPGTQVIELFPEYTVSSLFWMLASHFELKYGAIFGTSFDQDMALTNQAGSWDAPFIISENALRQYLKSLT